jgi:succinoglycan biosynthesis protein ExoA
MTRIERISVVAPLRDEAAHVDAFVGDLAGQDFGGDVEVLVADGTSTDGSTELLLSAAARTGVQLRIVHNPEGWVSPGLNRCITQARGDLIVRVDCHSRYPADYLRRCAALSERTGAWNVGGRVVAEGHTDMERAVAVAMNSPFGGIGWTRAGRAGGPVEVDTVTFGAFRPEAFARAGLFDETLVRNQDDEFNLRLRRAGGRIVLDPAVEVRYRPRGTLRGVWRQYYEYGLWKPVVMRKHGRVLSARSLAPVALVGSLAALTAAAPVSRRARRLLAAELAVYGAGAGAFAVAGLAQRREPARLLPRVAATFAAFHLGYGTGMARGAVLKARP